jgi:hypothetical protein
MGSIDSELNEREGREAQKPNSYILVCISLLAFVMCRNMAGQIRVDNPAKPSRKDAGRAVLLEEVFRIKDDGEKIIFKGRVDLAFSDDGALFFLAYNHLFKFSPSGQFIFKTIKEGEGPGECRQASRFFFMDGRIRVLSFAPPKVLDYDNSGRCLKEAKIRVRQRIFFLSFIDGKTYGIRDETAYSDNIGKEGLIESPYRLYEISEDFQTLKKVYDFPVQHYIKQHGWFRTIMVDWAASGHSLFAIHTAGYRIAKFDLRRAIVERIFTRKYTSPKIPKPEKKEDESDRELRGISLPHIEYSFDILRLLIFRDTLWVVTSTQKDNESNWLVDVFDFEGRYIDCFYLQFPPNHQKHLIQTSVLSNDGFLALSEESEDGFVSIAKYRILGKL